MNPRNQFRFPWVDASILLAMLLIGWASFRLAKLEPQIAGDRQLSRELPDSPIRMGRARTLWAGN